MHCNLVNKYGSYDFMENASEKDINRLFVAMRKNQGVIDESLERVKSRPHQWQFSPELQTIEHAIANFGSENVMCSSLFHLNLKIVR